MKCFLIQIVYIVIFREIYGVKSIKGLKNYELIIKRLNEIEYKKPPPKKIEARDDFGYCQVFDSLNETSRSCNVSTAATRYCIQHKKSDKKIFHFKEVFE